ncbi:hypothetical protein FO519_008112 [Halicephalobus sp. NKZ332]|nr:hypothetical protein FO519_008112 [Halicephalobus sp. NKZ332]
MGISQLFFATAFLGSLFLAQTWSRETSSENFEIQKREKRGPGNYGWYGHGQPPNFVPYVPNNNVAVGYPTAYGLGVGYIKSGHGYPGPGTNAPNPRNFPVRCINGGAHIGQCRLDNDAICIALGGICVNSACCTTPFFGLMTTTTTTEAPLVIDGETYIPKGYPHITLPCPETESLNGKLKSLENSEEVSEEIDVEKLKELSELSSLLELGRRAGLSTDSPIYAIFSGLLETTTPISPSSYSTVPPLSKWSTLPTTELPPKIISPSTTTVMTTTEAPRTESTTVFETTSRPSKKATMTTELPVNSIESHSVEDGADYGPNDYTKKYCDSGMKPIGPCNDDGSCPVDYSCQKGRICCYDYALVMMNSIVNRYKG